MCPEDIFHSGYQGPDPSLRSGSDEADLYSTPKVKGSENDTVPEVRHNSEEGDLTIDDMYDKLEEALAEVEKIKNEAYEESRNHRRVEIELLDANGRARIAGANYTKEMELRKEIEKKFKEELLASDQLFFSLQREKDELKKERAVLLMELDDAVREVEELQLITEGVSHRSPKFSEVLCLELEKATQSFDESLKIRECGYESVYNGHLNNTTVTIKILQTHCTLSEFRVLSRGGSFK